MKKLLVIQVAGLGFDFVARHGVQTLGGISIRPMHPVFPALTCTAQATLRTGAPIKQHGMPANGFFDTAMRKALFWEQSAALISGQRIWEDFRNRGGSVGLYFFQQSLGESVDQIISPAPIHTHGGGMIMDCYSQPRELYSRLSAQQHAFSLRHYWGPLASSKSSEWITQAMLTLLATPDTPDLCFVYLPGLDYDLQRFGPTHPRSTAALKVICREIEQLVSAATRNGYETAIFGDYAINAVTLGAVFPNRALKNAGLFTTRNIKGRQYPDFYQSPAFALVDHQIALINCLQPDALPKVSATLRALAGVDKIWNRAEQAELGLDHQRTGDLLISAKPGAWFAYPWWQTAREAPDYATHVDIHNKPGYDPCELFFGKNPFQISLDTAKVRGTHGLNQAADNTAFASTINFRADTLLDFAASLRAWLTS